MRVLYPLDHRFVGTPDGALWTEAAFPYAYWARYLEVFDELVLVARVEGREAPPASGRRADGEGVSFVAVPCYVGSLQFLRRWWEVRRSVLGLLQPGDAALFRMRSAIGSILEAQLHRRGFPYGLEVVGDPYDALAPGVIQDPLRGVARPFLVRTLQRQCARAAAVAYVTREALQRRYPPGPQSYTTHYSDVQLPAESFADTPRSFPLGNRAYTVITIGSLTYLHKGVDVLIDAVGLCVERGLDLRLHVVGDGRYRGVLEAQAAARGLGSRVAFLGQVPAGSPVMEQLDRADLFVLASRTEGLPRAMIEAMARGLPCVGTRVGGIPELLAEEDLVPPGDARALADRIAAAVGNPEELNRMAQRNLETAQNYRPEVLAQKRRAFYQYVRDLTAEWWRQHR